MLRGIHKATANWLGKAVMAAVMGLLIVSFAIWGIGDIFRGFGRTTLARVGDTEITVEQFRQFYNDRLQQISRQLGRPLLPDQVRALGIDQQLLAELLAQAALDDRARRLGLGITDAEIARRITEDPNFRSVTGQFDRIRFLQLLQSAGFTEARYVAEQRRFLLRRQISEGLMGEVRPPKAMVDAANRYSNEERSIDYIVLDRTKAGDIPQPTPEDLARYFEEHKAQFRAPEYRKLVVLSLTPADAARWITVSDEDAKAFYETHRDRFTTPERRHVQQIVFPNMAEARAAADRLAAGASFTALATERGLTLSDIDLGMLPKSGILDRAVADAAFSLPEGGVSAPIEGRFGVALVRVLKIEPGREPSYAEVADEVKREIAIDRGRAEVARRHDQVEDGRLTGQHLTEIAQKLGMQTTVIEAIDRSGRDPTGALIPALPGGSELLSAAFASDVGVDNDPLQLPDGGYVWYEVAGITRARDRSFEEVKAEVEARWRNNEIAERLKSRAAQLVDRLRGGAALADIAAAEGLKVESASALKRGRTSEVISASLLEEVFRTAKGGFGSAEGQNSTERVIFQITEVHLPATDPSANTTRQIDEALQRAYTEDLLGSYIARLESDLGVSINQAALRQVVGGGDTN